MKQKQSEIRKIFILTMMVGIIVLGVRPVGATISFVKSNEKSPHFVQVDGSEIPVQVEHKSRARAPEPATLALFGSGFLGMLMSFVRGTYALIKRVFDICAVIIGVIVLSPLLLFTAILVKLTSDGPILYSQVRVGKEGKNFNIYKFRTMKVNAEKASGPVWAAKNDNRLTPIGRFLRRTHIDEIPQLINILKGEMSLIGPRPERPVFVDKFKEQIPDYEKRLAVKPGITGLAQVWHRYDETIEDVKKKLKYDILYVKKMCFWADFNIIMRTFRVVVTGEGSR
jgi:exopolysaccharide biosynthesis polyprenyl glycosylphosphotransferase